MVEYTAAAVGLVGVLLSLLYITFNLSEKYDPLKILLIGISFVFGGVVIHLSGMIAEANTAPAGVTNALGIALGVWITTSILAITYILIWILPDAWRAMKIREKADKKGLYDE